MPKIKNETDYKRVEYRPIGLPDASFLILNHHYSHRLPPPIKLCFGEQEITSSTRTLVACCVFSQSSGRWPENLWELSRLVRLPNHETPLTKLIGKAVGWIRKEKLIDLLVSFADNEEDHHGGIYQAASWLYDGVRSERIDGYNIDGKFVVARTCNNNYRTSSLEELKIKLPGKNIVPHYDKGKHCYWKALNKEGMKKAIRLGLKSIAYPKPMIDGEQDINMSLKDGHNRKGIVGLPSLDLIVNTPEEIEKAQEESAKTRGTGSSILRKSAKK